MLAIVFTTYIILIFTNYVGGARILAVFPTPSYSHQVVFRPIVTQLSNRGHEVTVLTTDPQNNSSMKNLFEIDLSSAYNIWDLKILQNMNSLSEYNKLFDMIVNVANHEFSLPEVQNLLNSNEKFDIILVEFFFPSALAFGIKFNCPTVGIISMEATSYSHTIMGNPTNPVVYPDFQLPFTVPMKFSERIRAVIFRIVTTILMHYAYFPRQNEIIQNHFGNNTPSVLELMSNTSLLLLNVSPILHSIRPLGPSTIQIGGGIHLTPPKQLPKDIENFLDNSKNGVIYFSFGTNVKNESLTPNILKVILNSLTNLPYNILWKFDENIPNLPKNIKIIKWGPQQDILRHPNVKLFVTQGGLQSMEESIYSHVPMVCIPFLGDQERNARIIQEKKIGLQLDKNSLNEALLTKTILEVVENPKYRMEVKKVGELLADQQGTGVEKAVWWIEYVIRHNGAYHLRNHSYHMPLYQYYLLDVLALLSLLVIFSLYLTYRLFIFVRHIFK